MPIRKEVAAGILAVLGVVASVAMGFLIASLSIPDIPEYTTDTQVAGSAPEATLTSTPAQPTTTASVSTTAPAVVEANSPSPTSTLRPTRTATRISTRTAAPAATGTPSRTATPASTAAPTATPTATLADTATATPRPTGTTTPTPTPVLQSPPSPSPRPTFTNTPVPPTPTPTQVAYDPPTLVAPEDGAGRTLPTELNWSWNGTLASDEYFDVRVWQDGEPHNGVAWTKTPQITLPSSARRGTFFWSVAVIRGEDGQWLEDLSPEAPAREITISGGGSGPEPTPTR